jgi:transposase
VLFVGVDWAEVHHDVCLMGETGEVLQRLRIGDNLVGVHSVHEAIGNHVGDDDEVIVGIEKSQGLVPQALVAAGYTVYVINPLSASHYRERHTSSRAKSDVGDAKMLADVVRLDRNNHRVYVGDTELAEAIKILARAHKDLIWHRQRQINQLRVTLLKFYPAILEVFGTDLAKPEALAIMHKAPTPQQGWRLTLSQVEAILRKAGRKRRVESKAAAIESSLRAPHLEAPPLIADAYGAVVTALVATLEQLVQQINQMEEKLEASFDVHPDAEIIRSLPGLGPVLGARALGEFGDEPARFEDGRSRRNYAGTSPITIASGKKCTVVARHARNRRLSDTCDRWAFCALTGSPGARRLYDRQRAKGKTHGQALRKVANRLVGILDGCLRQRQLYSEQTAWGEAVMEQAA